MVPRWTVTDLGEDYFDRLHAEGIRLTPQEVLDIQRLSLEASGITDAERVRLSRGAPVLVGGSYLYPLTFAALEWLDAVEPLIRGESTRVMAMAAAMCHGHDRAIMATRGDDAVRIVKFFKKGLTATLSEVVEAIRLVTGETPLGEAAEDGPAGNLVLTAAALTGIEPDKLEHDVSVTYLAALVAEIVENNVRANGGQTPNPKLIALKELEAYVGKLRERHAKEIAENG